MSDALRVFEQRVRCSYLEYFAKESILNLSVVWVRVMTRENMRAGTPSHDASLYIVAVQKTRDYLGPMTRHMTAVRLRSCDTSKVPG